MHDTMYPPSPRGDMCGLHSVELDQVRNRMTQSDENTLENRDRVEPQKLFALCYESNR